MSRKAVVLSIRPSYAAKIMAGSKTIELRKKRPNGVRSGDLALLYVSAPKKALVGLFTIHSIVVHEPRQLWSLYKHIAGVTERFYWDYFADSASGCGIIIDEVWPLPEAISLAQLRRRIPGFCPPQSFRYLDSQELQAIPEASEARIKNLAVQVASSPGESCTTSRCAAGK